MSVYYIENDISDDETEDISLSEETLAQIKEDQDYEDNMNLLKIIKDFRQNCNPLILDQLDPVKFILFIDKLNPRPDCM